MRRRNFIGPNVVKYRLQRGWTQMKLLYRLEMLGCVITRQTLANVEIGRAPADDILILFFARVFCVAVQELFPEPWRHGSRIRGLADKCPQRRLRRSRYDEEPDSPR